MTEPTNKRARQAGVPIDHEFSDNASAAAEELNNHAQDIKEGMEGRLEDMQEDTPKTPEEFINKKGFSAWVTAEKIREKEEAKKKAKKGRVLVI